MSGVDALFVVQRKTLLFPNMHWCITFEYDGYLSIEMKNQKDIEKVKQAVLFLKEAF